MQNTQAIDLYSGVGGWSLGLRLAGIDVIASYEISDAANETNRRNNGHPVHTTDIRDMSSNAIPKVPYVVGSPPCTQFSTSNRGGSGDFQDGLRDVSRFLEIVDHVQPKAWAMENVPRLEAILAKELRVGGQLERFMHLGIRYRTFDLDRFGLPQRRRRCIAGNFDLDLLNSYAELAPPVSLGDVINALKQDVISDPNFHDILHSSCLFDHDLESPLSDEEVRINRASKALHPIYNSMQFPDALARPVRTITATCTRVSRESIIIESPDNPGQFRRLSVRERACAQGFPIGYQFFGKSHSQKLKMIGNAMPPVFSYYVGHALLGTPPEQICHTSKLKSNVSCSERPVSTTPHREGAKFLKDRTFRFAIPVLRMGSGVRFELTNRGPNKDIQWVTKLIYGTSKDIRSFQPNPEDASWIISKLPASFASTVMEIVDELDAYLLTVDIANLQAVWSHSGPGFTRPFLLLDKLDDFAVAAKDALCPYFGIDGSGLGDILTTVIGDAHQTRTAKLRERADAIVGGLVITSRTNAVLSRNKAVRWAPLNEGARIVGT